LAAHRRHQGDTVTVVKRDKPDPELIKLADSLLANDQKPADLIGENGLLKQLTKIMVRNSLNFVPWKAQKEVAADLKRIYGAASEAEAELRPAGFEEKWDKQYKPISQSWRRNWARHTVLRLPSASLQGHLHHEYD
jgi:hypothetical protein